MKYASHIVEGVLIMAKHRKPLPTPEEKAEKRQAQRLEKTKKIGLVLVAFAVLVAAFFTYSHFWGNPFSKMTAENNIEFHIIENYFSLDLDISPIKYNRETGSFYAEATSPKSEDTHFFVYTKGSEVWDYYEDSVTKLFNTIERVENTFTEAAKTALVEKGLAKDDSYVVVAVLDFIKARESGNFVIDMPVSADIQNDFVVYVELERETTVEAAAEALVEIKSVVDAAELPNIVLYNLTLVKDGKTFTAQNIPAEDIGTEKLANDLSFALENPSSSFGAAEDERPLRVSIR